MKKLFLVLSTLLVANFIIAQTTPIDNRKYISVTGSAEVIVAPDEIELEIVLKEFSKSSNRKADLLKIESELKDILIKHNIDEKKLVFGSSDYYWYYWWSYRYDKYKQKTFKIKLDSSTDFLSLVKDLDYKGVKSLRISNSSNKELQKLRKEVKISALRAAKEKATYLLESIDEKVGSIISVDEMPENQNYYWRSNQNLLSNVIVTTNSTGEDIDNVATIKLRYEVKAKFEIE